VEERRWETLAYKLKGVDVGNNQWLRVDVVCCRQFKVVGKVTKGLVGMVEVG
jgi:hypothetical protein